ncbi:MAG: right-handed parallel beta-helix repeat-containing protein, partial [Acidobacteriota bacterium]
MGRILLLAGILLVSGAVAPALGATWYVDGSVASSGDGTSAETALKRIQEGIDAAKDGDTVIVTQGTYVENIQFKGKNIVLRSTDPSDPSVVESTIIDGNQAGSVVTFDGTEDETCVLSGFTIQNGSPMAPFPDEGWGINGGSRYGDHTHATIQNNGIAGNSAHLGGGLASCAGVIQNNTISGNTADGGGGLDSCHGTIQNNTITDNSAVDGGGLYWCDGTIRNNTISGNSAALHGGGLHSCNGTIQNNTI